MFNRWDLIDHMDITVSSVSDIISIDLQSVSQSITLDLESKDPEIIIDLTSGELIHMSYPEYDGDYDVIPRSVPQVLPTKYTSLLDDVTVHEIPYSETSNDYGVTVNIGGR